MRGENISDSEKLIQLFREKADEEMDAKEAADNLEECRSAVKAEMIANQLVANPNLAMNRAEQNVLASREWTEYIHKMTAARKKANLLWVQRKVLEMRFMSWNSDAANERLKAKL